MFPRIDTIKQIRIKLGITQKKLASAVGISTSMINQIESGRSKPSYETARKIFDQLAALEGQSSSHKAGDFCSKSIVKLKPTNTLHDAIEKMHKYLTMLLYQHWCQITDKIRQEDMNGQKATASVHGYE